MARESLTIMIADDDGVEHEYQIAPHPAGISIGLFNRLQTILLGPLTALFASSRQTKANGNILDRELDPAAAASAAQVLARAVIEAGEERFVKQLLAYAHTRRAGDRALLKCSDSFDIIYTQNLGELAVALYHAIQVSFGKAIRRLMKGQPLFREVLSAINPTDSAPQTSAQQSER